MDGLSTDIKSPEQVDGDSTVVVDIPKADESQHKGLSRDEAIEKAMADFGDEAEKVEKPEVKQPEPKSEEQEKPETEKKADEQAPDPKPEEKAEKPEPEKVDEPKEPKRAPSEKLEAPKGFLPQAKENWQNVPHSVRSEVHRVIREHEEAATQLREQTQRYETLRPYDELAKSNGRDLTESLNKMVQVENMLQQHPIAGLNAILMEVGPRKADGQPISLYEVAEYIAQIGPEGYQKMMAAPQPQQQHGGNQQVEALQARIQQMETEMKVRPIIEQFRAANPRYDELQDTVAKFLESGMVPASLSPSEKLAVAYDMAVRINPTSHVATPQPDGSASDDRAANDFGGSSQSIKGAPPSGAGRSQSRRKLSKDEAVEAAMNAILN